MIPRYASKEMTAIFSQEAKIKYWTQVEKAACQSRCDLEEISQEANAKIQKLPFPTKERVNEIEKQTDHDLVAFIRALSEGLPEGERDSVGGHIHRGLTSSDIVDTSLALAIKDALFILENKLTTLTSVLKDKALEHKTTLCPGRTHGIHAEPTTFGLRMLGFYSEMTRNLHRIKSVQESTPFGKCSGAVGTFSQSSPAFEEKTLAILGLKPEPVATQVIPRDRHAELFSAFAILGGGIERIAKEVRNLQRTDVHEAEEGFKKGQTGSSAMPHKKNPILSERLCGMARILRGYLLTGMENIALWHDRDISHSSVERITLVDAFHLTDYMLAKTIHLIENLRVYPKHMQRNIDRLGGLMFAQSALTLLVDQGIERAKAYTIVQESAMAVWENKYTHLKEAFNANISLQGLIAEHALNEKELMAEIFSEIRFTKYIDTLYQRVLKV